MQPQTLIRRLIWNYPLLLPNRAAALAEILLDSDHNYRWQHGTVVLPPEQQAGLSHLVRRGVGASLADFKATQPELAADLGTQEILRLYQKDFENTRAVRRDIEGRLRETTLTPQTRTYARTKLADQTRLSFALPRPNPAWQAAMVELKAILEI
jgi:hypothetical protein